MLFASELAGPSVATILVCLWRFMAADLYPQNRFGHKGGGGGDGQAITPSSRPTLAKAAMARSS